MDRSRISTAVPDVGFVRARPDDLSGGCAAGGESRPAIAIVDGGRAYKLALVEELVGAGLRVIVFLPHVDASGAEQARRAGAVVLSRNRFLNDVGGVLDTVDADTHR